MKLLANILILSCCIFSFGKAFAQERIEGIVFDKDTKQRIGRVFLANITTGSNSFNNSRGEFAVDVKNGDQVVFEKENYFADTIVYQNEKVLIVNLKKKTIYIEPVTVVAKQTPMEILTKRREDYDKAYRLSDHGDFLSVGPNGAGLSIDAIYNLFSREAKNARRLTRYFDEEYKDNMVNMKFSKEFVRGVVPLDGEQLDNFMVRYRPSYEFVMSANHYQMIHYIRSKYEFFKHVPDLKPLPDLNKMGIAPKE